MQHRTTETSGGVETKTEEPIKYNPYAGASVGIKLGPLSLSVNSNVIFRYRLLNPCLSHKIGGTL